MSITYASASIVAGVPRISWTGAPGASTRVYRDVQLSGATKTLIATVSAGTSTYDDTNVVGGTTYYYFLAPVTNGVEGALTTPASFPKAVLWIDPADASKLTYTGASVGGTVTAIGDKSSMNYTPSITGTLKTASTNGLTTIDLNSSRINVSNFA